MPNVALEPLLYPTLGRTTNHKIHTKLVKSKSFSLNCSLKPVKFGGSISSFLKPSVFPFLTPCSATTTTTASDTQTAESTDIVYSKTFPLHRIETIEGKIFIRLDQGKDGNNRQLSVGCSLPGNWVLHWGVYYVGDSGSEWDQPPVEMRPPGSICIKDYAIETPLLDVSEGGERLYEVKIDVNCKSEIAAIIFVLKDEETGSWYQHKGRDFKVPLVDRFQDGDCVVGARSGFNLFTKATRQVYNVFVKEERRPKAQDSSKISVEGSQTNRLSEGIYYEQHVVKNVPVDNLVSVSVRRCPETAKNLLYMETDLSGDVVVHWGVCRDSTKKWEVPNAPYPADTGVFKNKALRTRLQPKKDGNGHTGFFTLDQGSAAFAFVLKLNNETWLNCMGNDFFIPLSTPSSADVPSQNDQYEDEGRNDTLGMRSSSSDVVEEAIEQNQEVSTDHTDGIIHDIRSLVSDLSSDKKWKIKSKEVQERILHEIEKLAAEAYSIFRISVPTFSEESILETEEEQPSVKIASGTGSGFEILCQGFNWESHKSRSWYMELHERAEELSTIGFTIIWLPPPTDSVSPEGYMPRDLYNLNSRYGTIDELKTVVKKFHEAGLKVLGDVVLNHRCAHHQNKNGIWNIFGGRLNWDDRAIVADDPHFQGRGNKSSGDFFHAAPNIDHSQEFVRNDIKEWMRWLRKDIGYDGWRLDFVRGFWGGYVKDYLDATEPYFAVGEYWDSLSYTYNEMDYDQDAHRQRIIDWINATGGAAGAFDVTTKGILHSALERCEYWRLSDAKGKPPGVVGWWPSRAVTFIENHDTGSTQGHWRFPGGKEMQGYTYILTHPGTPAVFYDHIFSRYQSELSALISLRNRKKIHCRSTVKITKADRDVYAATIDDEVAMKIGPGHFEPSNDSRQWSLAVEGNDYRVWEAS